MEERDSQTFKRRRILGDNEAWDGRIADVKCGIYLADL